MMTGHFDNKDQFNKMQAEGKINNLPKDFKGKFVVEERELL